MMALRPLRVLAMSIACLVTEVGCHRSNNADVIQVKAEAEAAMAEAKAAKAELAKANAELAELKTSPADKPKVDPDQPTAAKGTEGKGPKDGVYRNRAALFADVPKDAYPKAGADAGIERAAAKKWYQANLPGRVIEWTVPVDSVAVTPANWRRSA